MQLAENLTWTGLRQRRHSLQNTNVNVFTESGAVHFQQALMKANENINWSKIVIWHQWEQFDLDEEENSEKEKKNEEKVG